MKRLLIFLFFLLSSGVGYSQIILNSDIMVATQRSVDGKQYHVVYGKHYPYKDTAQFLIEIPKTRRHVGEVAYVFNSDSTAINVWQFVGGIESANLKQANAFIPLSQKAEIDGVATLNHLGKVPLSQLPAFALNEPTYVQTLVEMLGNDSAMVGKITVVGDSSKSYALMSEPSSNFGNWLEILSPIPSNTDLLPEGVVNLYSTVARIRAALNGGGTVIYNPLTGLITGTGVTMFQVDSIIASKPKFIDSIFTKSSNNSDTIFYTKNGVRFKAGIVDYERDFISGGDLRPVIDVWTYEVSPSVFRKNGRRYTTVKDTIQIAGFSTETARIDAVVADTSGNITVLTGQQNTGVPGVIDTSYQVVLNTIFIQKGNTFSRYRPTTAYKKAGTDSVFFYDQRVEGSWFVYKDSVGATKTYVDSPLYAKNDSTIAIRHDAMPNLSGRKWSTRDDSQFTDSTFADVKFVLDNAGAGGCPILYTVSADSLYINKDSCGVIVRQYNYIGDGSGSGGIGGIEDVMAGTGITIDKTVASKPVINAVSDALKQDKITLTTTGTSGAATFTGGVLNIPNYAGGGGGSSEVKQEYTGSTAVTVNNATTWLIINPATTSTTTTITLPATPTDMQKIEISFGGTVTSGAVVTSLTIAPNSGQSVLGTTAFGTVEVMDKITLRYNSTNSKWY